MKFILIFWSICLVSYYVKRILSNSLDQSINHKSKERLLTQDAQKYQEEIETQLELLKKNEKLPIEMDQKLKEVTDIMRIIEETQEIQRNKLSGFVISLEQTKESLQKMLSEYENRINQLEYTIMQMKTYDPFIETYNYPISKFWIKIDHTNRKSHWKYLKTKNYTCISQENEVVSSNVPATILLLKYHKLIDGFVSADILLKPEESSQMNQAAAGIIFHFNNSINYRVVELSLMEDQIFLLIGEVVNDTFNKISSVKVEVKPNEFNTLTCEFIHRKVHIFVNYKQVIELTISEEQVKNAIGLFTKIGKAEFKNFKSGNLAFEKELDHQLKKYTGQNIVKTTLSDSFRFAEKISKDDLSVYEIPYAPIDYDAYIPQSTEDVYPVPDSGSYYNQPTPSVGKVSEGEEGIISKDEKDSTCMNYDNPKIEIQDWINNNPSFTWKVQNEFGIDRVIVQSGIKNPIHNATFIYKYGSCNSLFISAFVKLETESEAGLVFRYDNKEDMYLITISNKTQDITLKKVKNKMETTIKTDSSKTINSFQRHFISVQDDGEQGTIIVSLDDQQVFVVKEEYYYKAGSFGLFVQHGYASFDTLRVQAKKGK